MAAVRTEQWTRQHSVVVPRPQRQCAVAARRQAADRACPRQPHLHRTGAGRESGRAASTQCGGGRGERVPMHHAAPRLRTACVALSDHVTGDVCRRAGTRSTCSTALVHVSHDAGRFSGDDLRALSHRSAPCTYDVPAGPAVQLHQLIAHVLSVLGVESCKRSRSGFRLACAGTATQLRQKTPMRHVRSLHMLLRTGTAQYSLCIGTRALREGEKGLHQKAHPTHQVTFRAG